MRSDCGTNFKGASNELMLELKRMRMNHPENRRESQTMGGDRLRLYNSSGIDGTVSTSRKFDGEKQMDSRVEKRPDRRSGNGARRQ